MCYSISYYILHYSTLPYPTLTQLTCHVSRKGQPSAMLMISKAMQILFLPFYESLPYRALLHTARLAFYYDAASLI